jgi:peptide/nickel transport system permease protein
MALVPSAATDGLLATTPAALGGAGLWRTAWRRVLRRKSVVVALAVLAALVLLALLAPLVAPHGPKEQLDLVNLRSQPPSAAHPFGTDQFSRDALSRVIHGTRVSLSVAVLAMLLAATVGTAYGAVSGLRGGMVDTVMMRLLDALLSIPRVLLLVAVLSLWGDLGLVALVLLLGLTGWFGVSRLVRAEVLAVREREFVEAARALGATDARLLGAHVLPNVLAPVVVAATLGVGDVIVLEAGLSYLGIGVRPPHASWGNIIQDGGVQVGTQWWLALFPGLAIVTTVLAFNVVGDALREALDPRQAGR